MSGTIDISLQQPIDVVSLEVDFVGVERSHLSLSGVIKPNMIHREVKEIIRLKANVQNFEAMLGRGQYTYPFMLYLPTWLPDSSLLKQKSGEKLMVEYTVRAQFIPRSKKDFVVDARIPELHQNVSLFRGSRKIFVY